MNKTLSIGLAGFSFVIEEHAYIKLSDYLSALRNSLDANEADEVMHDIEIRIVEILREQMAKREVVNDEDVEKVIAQIGKPEVIEEQEQAYFSEKTEKPRAFSGQKQLFRDPEGKILGGVSGGLGHYFGIDKVWVRLIFIILIFAKGFGLLLYPILWLVIPVANSASDFLKMKGKPANFDNLKNESNKIVQFANESTQRVGQLYQENKHYVADAGNGFATFLRVVFGGIFAFLALIFIIATVALFGLFGNSTFPGATMFNYIFDEGGMNTVLIIISVLTFLIPAIIFTSFGPNSAGKVKPDASARGTSTYFAYNNGAYPGNGTSYATPLSAGGIACLLQAIPNSTNREFLKNTLRQTASLYPNYTDQLGYGILNFGNALSSFLSTNENALKSKIKIYPIPAKNEINISTTEKLKNISVYNSLGQFLFNSNASKINVEKLEKGIYFIKITTEKGELVEKFIKE